ncbi:MAG: hypothetical protein LBV12_12435 [Puniceicoccales bacterium]|jgi:hypothetical protein|nr:hypothetical protein [Puniceicoccales bacterium]
MDKTIIETVKEWFSRESGGSLSLPDGWFGRPYDNRHSLTSFAQTSDGYELILDKTIKINFDDIKYALDNKNELCIGGYGICRFAWKEFDDGMPNFKIYNEGEIKLIK